MCALKSALFFCFCRCFCSVRYFYAIVSLEYSTGCVMNLKQRAKHTSILSECAMSFLPRFLSIPLPLSPIDAKIYPMPICFCRSIRKLYISIICYAFFSLFYFRVIRKLPINDVSLTGQKRAKKNNKKQMHSTITVQMKITLLLFSRSSIFRSGCTPEKLLCVGCFHFWKREKRFDLHWHSFWRNVWEWVFLGFLSIRWRFVQTECATASFQLIIHQCIRFGRLTGGTRMDKCCIIASIGMWRVSNSRLSYD